MEDYGDEYDDYGGDTYDQEDDVYDAQEDGGSDDDGEGVLADQALALASGGQDELDLNVPVEGDDDGGDDDEEEEGGGDVSY